MKNYDYKQIDVIFHSRIRLAASALLYHDGQVDFNTMKAQTSATDGNLATHLGKMEEAGYVKVEKMFSGRKPLTIYSLTDIGKKSFETYINRLESIIRPQKDTTKNNGEET